MPIYEFECHSCGTHFEQLVLPWIAESMKNGQSPECPKCHATDVARLVSECAISSEQTRQSNAQKAKKANEKGFREKQDADNKERMEHANEHA